MEKFVYINKRDTCPKLSKYPNNQKYISVTVVIAVTLVTFPKQVNFC